MRRTLSILAITLAMTAIPVLAGSDHGSHKAKEAGAKKCTAETQVCLDYMVENLGKRGWVGIELDAHDGEMLEITTVEPRSPAEAAGLKAGDVLVAMNGIRFSEENGEAMKAAHAKMKIGANVTYTVDRAGRTIDLDVTLGEMPDAVRAKWIGRHMLDHASVEVASN